MNKQVKIALGMSGGVDSAVSADILMRAGYEVVGVTLVFFEDKSSAAAVADAAAVCETLGIKHYVHECVHEFKDNVIVPFVDQYEKGFTPSPCIECNAICKIPQLMQAAARLGCPMVATGHYARTSYLEDADRFIIKTALDRSKDQSYMLALLSQDQLKKLVLPLGGMTKAEVRIIAQDLGLPVADKQDSQDICFIEGSHIDFLIDEGLKGVSGEIVNLQGEVLGFHDGLFRYTIGQRKGIGVGGAAEPYYVIEKRGESNQLVVGFQSAAYLSSLTVNSLNWQAIAGLEQPLACTCKIRYRSSPVSCVVTPCEKGGVHVDFNEPQPLTAPGQYAVFYMADTVIGGGKIVSINERKRA